MPDKTRGPFFKMKKILLTAINARFSHSNLALMYLRGAAEGLPFEVEIAEYTIKRPVEEIAHDISVREPHAVALSVYIWNSSMIKKLAPIIKSMMPESLIIMGGPEVSFNPEKWLSEVSSIDFIVTGPGEAPFRRLLESDFDTETGLSAAAAVTSRRSPFPTGKLILTDCEAGTYTTKAAAAVHSAAATASPQGRNTGWSREVLRM
jgi:radical SAM superfamily enzyme YgiQ (UPF0313 family)